MLARHHLAWAEVDVHCILAAGRPAVARFRRAPDIDVELGDVISPVLRRDLCICLDTVAVGLVDGVGMVLARLDRLRSELLRHLRHQLVVIGSGRR